LSEFHSRRVSSNTDTLFGSEHNGGEFCGEVSLKSLALDQCIDLFAPDLQLRFETLQEALVDSSHQRSQIGASSFGPAGSFWLELVVVKRHADMVGGDA